MFILPIDCLPNLEILWMREHLKYWCNESSSRINEQIELILHHFVESKQKAVKKARYFISLGLKATLTIGMQQMKMELRRLEELSQKSW